MCICGVLSMEPTRWMLAAKYISHHTSYPSEFHIFSPFFCVYVGVLFFDIPWKAKQPHVCRYTRCCFNTQAWGVVEEKVEDGIALQCGQSGGEFFRGKGTEPIPSPIDSAFSPLQSSRFSFFLNINSSDRYSLATLHWHKPKTFRISLKLGSVYIHIYNPVRVFVFVLTILVAML